MACGCGGERKMRRKRSLKKLMLISSNKVVASYCVLKNEDKGQFMRFSPPYLFYAPFVVGSYLGFLSYFVNTLTVWPKIEENTSSYNN